MGKVDLSEQAMELKFAGKQLINQAKGLEKDVVKLREEVGRLISQNNRELANTKANLLVVKQGQINQLHKLAGQMEIMATQMEIGGLMMENAKEIKKVNKNLQKALASMDTNALAKIMHDFAKTDKNLSMNTAFMGQIMGEQTSANMDCQAAGRLIQEIAMEQSIALPSSFADLSVQQAAAADLEKEEEIM